MSPAKRAAGFLDPEEDPRPEETSLGDERTTLTDFLAYQRQTLELKCAGLSPEQLAARSVPPSTMSLLGLVRHLAEVERGWWQQIMAGNGAPRIYRTEDEPDLDFDGAVGDQACVDDAWAALRAEQAFGDRFVEESADLGMVVTYHHGRISLRELLVHLVEEYARHNGHADLLRERIDGRLGE